MDERSKLRALLRDGDLADITTTGRRSGEARRIEITYFVIDDRIYVSGTPGRRAWMANLAADSRLTFHLKRRGRADLPATARIIRDVDERRPIVEHVCAAWGRGPQLPAFLAGSPVIEIVLDRPNLVA
jgi:deazaflavin-dependent oxidoreductase (nitroreductase family)